MKNLIVVLILLLLHYTPSYAQSRADSIETVKKGHRYHYMQNGKELTAKQLSIALRKDPAAKKLIERSGTDAICATVLAGGGGGMIGAQLGTALANGSKILPGVIIAGVACIALAIPISKNSERLQTRAIRTYNEDLGKTSYHSFRPQYYLSVTGNRVGLTMQF